MKTKIMKVLVALVATVVIGIGVGGVLHMNSYYDDVKHKAKAIVEEEGYEVTGYFDNQRRVREHHGIDEPVATLTDPWENYRYLIWADGSCERICYQ